MNAVARTLAAASAADGRTSALPVELIALGHKAHAALRASGGSARPLAAFPQAPYFEAAGEIIWLGHSLPARHPRAAITASPVAAGSAVRIGALPDCAWRRALPPIGTVDARIVHAGAAALLDTVAALGPPRGFGALLGNTGLGFPLNLALPRVHTLAGAYAASDAAAVRAASQTLLGLGAGLTPSGDDLVAAALFGRRLIDRNGAWACTGRELARVAGSASHAISAALFADTAAGESFEPLHELAEALAAGDKDAALAGARTLVCIGHASGWDMLAGLLLGILGKRMIAGD
jgi:hypothetical protein